MQPCPTKETRQKTSLMRALKGSPGAKITSAFDPDATVLKVANQNL